MKKIAVPSKESTQAKEKGLLSFLGGFFGFFLAMASLFLLLFDSPLPLLSIAFPGGDIPGSVMLAGTIVVSLLLLRWKSVQLTNISESLALKACAIAGSCLAPFGLLSEQAWPVALPFVAVGIALTSYLWCLYLCKFTHMLLVSLVSIAFVLAAGTAGVVAALDLPNVATLFVESSLALLSLFLLGLQPTAGSGELLMVSPKESSRRAVTKNIDRWTYSVIGLDFGFSIGLIQGLAFARSEASSSAWIVDAHIFACVFVIPVILAGILLLVIRPRFNNTIEKYSKDFLAFSFAVGTLPLTILPAEGQIICMMILLLVSCVQVIIVINASIEFIRFEELSPAWYMGEEAFVAGGIAVGLSFAWLTGTSGSPDQPFLFIGCFAVVLAGAFAQPVISRGCYPTQIDFRSSRAPKETREEEEASLCEGHQLESKELGRLDKGGSWRAKIDYVSRQHDLSPRQGEVLEFLAKGRDAKFIEDHFCISKSTAKSHIYNIYCKLDIHSRQELLDMIESVDFHTASKGAGNNTPLSCHSPSQRLPKPSLSTTTLWNDSANQKRGMKAPSHYPPK